MCDTNFSWVDFLFQGDVCRVSKILPRSPWQWNTLCVPNYLISCCSISSQVTWVSGKSVQPCSAYPSQGRQAWDATRRCFSPHLYTHVLCMEPSAPVSRGPEIRPLTQTSGSVCEASLPLSIPHVSHLAKQTKHGKAGSRLLLWHSSLLGCEHMGFPIGFFLDDNLAHCWGSVPVFWTNE